MYQYGIDEYSVPFDPQKPFLTCGDWRDNAKDLVRVPSEVRGRWLIAIDRRMREAAGLKGD